MNETIRSLLDVQSIDAELSNIERDLNRYKENLKGRAKEVTRLEQNAEKAENAIRDLELRVRESEAQVEAWRAEIEKFNKQIMNVKNSKEYEALQQEILEREKLISDADDKGIAFLEEEEHLQSELGKVKENLEIRSEEYQKEKQRVTERVKELEELAETLRQQRPIALDKVDPVLKSRYDNLAGRFPGQALVPIEGDNCGGCHMNVVKATIQKAATNGGTLVECTSCRRFMYLTDEDIKKHKSE